MASFDTKHLDILISALETISKFTVVGQAEILGPLLLEKQILELKEEKAKYLKFTAEYDKKTTETLRKFKED